MADVGYALSLKQPWATLLVHGLKTIEIRRWATQRRGRVLIHAARVPDVQEWGWKQLPAALHAEAQVGGGIIGAGELTGCVAYRSVAAFALDRERHRNDPAWFRPPVMYGFTFTNLTQLPFQRCPGNVRFFPVESAEGRLPLGMPPLAAGPGLLVSVRDAPEAAAALAGGAALIDVKEPRRGPLGRADDATIAAVVASVAGRRPVSAALGELREATPLPAVAGLSFVKWGLAGVGRNWRSLLTARIAQLRQTLPGCEPVAAAYADWHEAVAPLPESVAVFAADHGCGAFLLDTWQKDGRTLLDWMPPERIAALCRRCAAAGVPVALAGSLDVEQMEKLASLAPRWFAVRGAVCFAGRETAVDVERVRRLAGQLAR